MPLRLLLVDDHAEFRAAAAALLERDGLNVVGSVGSGEAALREVSRLLPDVVLLDVQLPCLDGFAVAALLAAASDAPAVILMSSRDAAVYATRLAASPARGLIPKSKLSGAELRNLLV